MICSLCAVRVVRYGAQNFMMARNERLREDCIMDDMKQNFIKFSAEDLRSFRLDIPHGDGECVRYAADKLQEYLYRTMHVSLRTDAAKGGRSFSLDLSDDVCISDDGFIFSFFEEGIAITASTPRGIMYGVYSFIEEYLGVRFLTAKAEYVPARDVVVLPLGRRTEKPAFAMRTYLVGDTFQKTADPDHMARTKIKDLFTVSDMRHGGPTRVYGRGINHNFRLYVPFEKYGNTHPEFYRFFYEFEKIFYTIDLTNGITDDGALDESVDISVAKIVIEELKKDIDAHPEADVFNFTQEDGCYYYESERNTRLAEKYKRSGILIRFCNVVVRELNKYARAKYGKTVNLMTFAYSYTKDAPVQENGGQIFPIDDTVVADDNLIIQLALFGNEKEGYFSSAQNTEAGRIIGEWKHIARHFWFWGYDTNFYRYHAFFDSFHNIRANIDGFRQMGVEYLCMHGAHESTTNWQSLIRGYVYRKMMWDDTLSADELTDEFIRLYYGAGADSVRRTISIFEKMFENALYDGEGRTTKCESHLPQYNPPEKLYEAIAALEKGEGAVLAAGYSAEEEAKYLERLANVKATPLLLLYDNFFDYFPSGSREKYREAEDMFFRTAERGKVDYIGERWRLEQYRKEGSASLYRRNVNGKRPIALESL